VAGNIAVAWALTLPTSALLGAAVYGLVSLLGHGAAAALVILGLAGAGVAAGIWARRPQAEPVPG
jgi:hypothetical protein